MHTFVGMDQLPSGMTPATASYGLWTDADVTDDGDNRDATNANLAAQAAINRSNWIGWRLINIVDGGTYAFTAPITIKNAFTFGGHCRVEGDVNTDWWFLAPVGVANGKTINIGDPSSSLGIGHVKINTGSDLVSNGPATFNDDVTFNDPVVATDVVVFSNEVTLSGIDAFTAHRSRNLNNTMAGNYQFTNADTWVLAQNTAAAYTINFIVPSLSGNQSAPDVYRFIVRQENKGAAYSNTFNVTVQFSGTSILVFAAGAVSKNRPGMVVLEWNNAEGRLSVIGLQDPNSVITVL